MPVDNRTGQLESILAGLVLIDPRLYDFLSLLLHQVDSVTTTLEPIEANIQAEAQVSIVPPLPPGTASFTLLLDAVRINWAPVDGALFYELRKGDVWDTAEFKTKTPSTQADLLPFGPDGDHKFLIKSISSGGTYSDTTLELVVTIPDPPAVVITPQVIDNNVLLRWTAPVHPFRLARYRFRRNSAFHASVAGSATFFTHFETVGGVYTYGLRAEDIGGNVSPISDLQVTVNQPPDFDLQDEFTDDFSGTKINVILQDNGRLLAVVDTNETWEGHFASRSWASIQAQIDAGYPLYAQPSRYP